MENRKASGIFLGVVSVATLIVAIIGATFAYFSVSVTGDSTVNVGAYEFSATMSISQIYPRTATDGIIPMNASTALTFDGVQEGVNNTNLLYAINSAENRCIDSNGHQVCAVYKVVINNTSSSRVSLNGYMVPTENYASESRENATGFMHLVSQKVDYVSGTLEGNNLILSLNGTPDEFDYDNNSHIIKIAPEANSVALGSILVPAAQTIAGSDEPEPGKAEKYILIYLNDSGDQSSEMGAHFAAQVTFTSDDSSSRLTGTFNFS